MYVSNVFKLSLKCYGATSYKMFLSLDQVICFFKIAHPNDVSMWI